jgi:hypothetical protein
VVAVGRLGRCSFKRIRSFARMVVVVVVVEDAVCRGVHVSGCVQGKGVLVCSAPNDEGSMIPSSYP